MSRETLFPLTLRLTALRLRSSKLGLVVAGAFPAALAVAAVRDSYETALRIFLFAFPHLFLIAAQDMAGTERTGGGLENVIFLDGRFRRYFWQKNLAVLGLAGAYVSVLFLLLALLGVALGRFEPAWAPQFGMGLLAGSYYVAAAGALSYALRAGANVAVVLFVQAGALVGLLFSATNRAGLIDHLAAGIFPDAGSCFLFAGLVAVLPNLAVARKLSAGVLVIAAALALCLAVQRLLAARLEIRR